MFNIKNIGILLITFAIGGGMGYFFAPDKIKIEEKIVEKTKTVKEEQKKVTEKFDPNTGKVVERVEETGSKETKTNSTESEKKKETEKTRKSWALKAGVAVPLDDINKQIPRIGGEFRLPIFDSWAGVEVDVDVKNPKAGLYLRLEF